MEYKIPAFNRLTKKMYSGCVPKLIEHMKNPYCTLTGSTLLDRAVIEQIRHEESLHPHDAVAVITKGVPGGFEA